jgi:iron complex outermembrane recepter protein
MRLAALALAAALAPAALAQTGEAVLIEATRFPEDSRRLPASVTVLDEADIARSSARTLPELLSGQAGINMTDLYGNNAALAAIDLRGFGATGTQNTLVLVDGRRVTDIDLAGVQWAAIPLSAIERIEILRGTGAVLYGDGATTGVVNIVTRSPLRQGKRAEAMGRAASYGTFEGQLYASAAGDTLGVNATLQGYDSDGYRDNNRNEQGNAAFNLRWGPGETYLDLRAGLDRQNLRLPGARAVQPSIGLNEYASDPRGTSTPLDWSSLDSERIGATLVTRLGRAELNVGADWRGKDQNAYFDFGGFPVYRDDALDYAALTPRMRVPFETGGWRHRVTLGIDLIRWGYDSRRSDQPQNIGQPINQVRVDRDNQAVYVKDAIDIGTGTRLEAGWREERADYEASDVFDPSAPGGMFGTGAPPASARQSEYAWELGVRQALSAAWAGFARAGRSFRFVGVDEIYENDAFFAAQFQILQPQTANTVELGAEWNSGKARLRTSLFRIDVENEIHLDPFSAGIGNTNLPPTRRRGVELDGAVGVGRSLRLFGAYTYTDARFLSGTLPGNAFIGTDLDIAGKHVPLVPEHKLNLGFAWDLGAHMQLSGALAAVSSQYMDNDEPNDFGTKIPAYTILDLKLTREFRWGRLAATINDLLDEQYYTYAVRSNFVPDRYNVYPLPARTLSLVAELKID